MLSVALEQLNELQREVSKKTNTIVALREELQRYTVAKVSDAPAA